MRRPIMLLTLGAALLGAVPVLAANAGPIDQPATATAPAERIPNTSNGDVVTIYNVGDLRNDVARAAADASRAAGGRSAIGRSASIGMPRVRRGSSIVQAAPSGFAYPMGTTMLPTTLVSELMGPGVAAVLSSTQIVMSSGTAELRGALAGDVVELVASNGAVVEFTIAAVVDDAITGGTELLISLEAADRLQVFRESQIVLTGFDSRVRLDAELAARGLVSTSIRIRRSWDPADPDDTIGMAETKAALGEFAYAVSPSTGAVTLDSAWRSANITSGSIGRLRLQTGCHRVVRVALQAAMNEVIASGLENTIDYADANSAGGCWVPRFNRLTPNSSIGFLSRHSWGMAIDTNTQGSCQGCAPPDMDCRTVRIFRRHGFAWGGNFLRPDGMHFEWVGERRDIGRYPSRYCQNVLTDDGLRSGTAAWSTDTQRTTLFADAGLYDGD